MAVLIPSRLSWSAVSSYAECGERFRLERMYRLPRNTWFSTIGGKAVHEVTEFIDRTEFAGMDLDEALTFAPTFQSVFDKLLAEEDDGVEIRASQKKGMKTITESGGPDGKDYNWWLHWGPIFVQRYVRWRKARGWEIAVMSDGRPGIELEFDMTIAGKRVQGFIDRVFYDPECDARILVDIKNGKKPTGILQLVTYDLGLEVNYGEGCEYAMYWLPTSPAYYKGTEEENVGQVSDLYDLRNWDLEKAAKMFENALAGIQAGAFVPQVTNLCNGCSVRDYCWAVGGEKSGEMPVDDEIVDPSTGELA